MYPEKVIGAVRWLPLLNLFTQQGRTHGQKAIQIAGESIRAARASSSSKEKTASTAEEIIRLRHRKPTGRGRARLGKTGSADRAPPAAQFGSRNPARQRQGPSKNQSGEVENRANLRSRLKWRWVNARGSPYPQPAFVFSSRCYGAKAGAFAGRATNQQTGAIMSRRSGSITKPAIKSAIAGHLVRLRPSRRAADQRFPIP